jgi:hypothetical protein
MKYFLKLSLVVLSFVISTSTFAQDHSNISNIDDKTFVNDDRTVARQLLTSVIYAINDSLPEELCNGFIMNSAKIEGNYIVFTFLIDSSDLHFELFKLMEPEIKNLFFNEILDMEGGLVRELLVQSGYGSKIVFKDKNSDATHTFRIEVNEIVMAHTTITMGQISKQQAIEILETRVKEMQKEMSSDEGSISLSKDCLTLTCYIENLGEEIEEIKQQYQEMSSQQLMEIFGIGEEMAKVCKAAEVNIEFVGVDPQSQKYVEFVIPYKDM